MPQLATAAPVNPPPPRAPPSTARCLLPLGALLLCGSLPVAAQESSAAPAPSVALTPVVVTGQSEGPDRIGLRATRTQIGKGTQALRDIPQSVTVMTGQLLDDRNLDDLREVLKTTAGVSFQAGETGEEDVRIRGFSLGQAGDIYVDGLRDAPLVERDTFNQDRVEVLKGSASMLFGKGSTGGVVNQVSKMPFRMNQSEVGLMVGSGGERRITGDFNVQTGERAALRVNVLDHDADRGGATVRKRGIAPTLRWGMGMNDEFSLGFYHLETQSRPIYNHPWFLSGGTRGEIIPTLPADRYYGLASDYLKTRTSYVTGTHLHRFEGDTELKTTVRRGHYERDLWATVVRFASGTTPANLSDQTVLLRTPKGRVGDSDLTQVQSDLTHRFEAVGLRHQLITGVDLSHEDAHRNNNYTGSAAAARPATTVGTPNDGAVSPVERGSPPLSGFLARSLGVHAQDLVSLSPELKLLGGVRLDQFRAAYRDAAGNSQDLSASLWSPRLGVLYQPDDTRSWYVSWGTSYNTSGDTYQYALGSFAAGSANARLANTPPERSRNLELGGKFELLDKKLSLGVALFHAEKFNERNTDADTAATQYLLSGRRHATGVELNLAGRLSPSWDIFYNHTWIPDARIDQSNVALSADGNGAQVQGDRPALTPRHSASLWTTWRLDARWRLGAGLNHRGAQNPEGARQITAQAFTTVDGMVEYTVSDSRSVKLNIRNLANLLYADTLYRAFYAPGASRTVQVSYKSLF